MIIGRFFDAVRFVNYRVVKILLKIIVKFEKEREREREREREERMTIIFFRILLFFDQIKVHRRYIHYGKY